MSTTCGTPGYVAPEVIDSQYGKAYGKECDYWSIGVVAFILLSGSPPFYAQDTLEMFDMIRACKYSFAAPQWMNVSKEAKDFVSKLMVRDPKARLTPKQMMNHPWMKKDLNTKFSFVKKDELTDFMVGLKSMRQITPDTEASSKECNEKN